MEWMAHWHRTTQTDTVGTCIEIFTCCVAHDIYMYMIFYTVFEVWLNHPEANHPIPRRRKKEKVFRMNFLCRRNGNKYSMIQNMTWHRLICFTHFNTRIHRKCTRHQNLKSHKTHLQFVRTNHSNMFQSGRGNGNGVDVWFSFRVDIKSNWLYTILSWQSH